jgi:hypothetical protein
VDVTVIADRALFARLLGQSGMVEAAGVGTLWMRSTPWRRSAARGSTLLQNPPRLTLGGLMIVIFGAMLAAIRLMLP